MAERGHWRGQVTGLAVFGGHLDVSCLFGKLHGTGLYELHRNKHFSAWNSSPNSLEDYVWHEQGMRSISVLLWSFAVSVLGTKLPAPECLAAQLHVPVSKSKVSLLFLGNELCISVSLGKTTQLKHMHKLFPSQLVFVSWCETWGFLSLERSWASVFLQGRL